jgi:hypothetical protein
LSRGTVDVILKGRRFTVTMSSSRRPTGPCSGSADIAAMSKERSTAAGGFFPMETSAQYREFAAQCDRLVEETADPRHKQSLREMAEAWRVLAADRDGKKTP